jgi:alginate O-acetyltransferase complex protein AlgI
VNTEITDKEARSGWVLYDGACDICKGVVRRFGASLRRRGFECVPLQTPWVRERLNMAEDELMLEMRVMEPSGNVVGGAAGVLLLARKFWWALPLVWFAKLPGAFRFLDAAYRWGAARRYCANRACALPRRRRDNESHSNSLSREVRDSFPRLLRYGISVLPLSVPFLLHDVEPWAFMWGMAGALWLTLKLFTFLDVPRRPLGRSLAYLVAWPGMDAPEFFSNAVVAPPTWRHWFFASLNLAVGGAFLYGAARIAYAHSALLAGWMGMIGIVMILHFGIFKFLALLWRAAGIPATPIMEAPLRSRSLSEFWGRRWNTGFSVPARRYLMEPLARRFGTARGLVAVFLVSGLVHELVISLPAKAGFGFPTLYFLIQAAALSYERRHTASRVLTLVCVAAPAFMLFHPPFIHRVIIPFLKAIRAL